MRIDFYVRLRVLLRSRQLENPHTVNAIRRITINAPFLARFPLDDTERSLRGGTHRRKTRSFYDHYGLIEVASICTHKHFSPHDNRDFEEYYSSICCEAPRRYFNINFVCMNWIWLKCVPYRGSMGAAFFSCVAFSCELQNDGFYFIFVLGCLKLFFSQYDRMR